MSRRLFCEISPFTYRLSTWKCRILRRIQNVVSHTRFCRAHSRVELPVLIYSHKSLIRRRLGNVDMHLQENKATNLALSAPRVTHILIRPGETFSFWRLVGCPSKRKGYREGLMIANRQTTSGIGGGMCQFTNLIHWMVLHTPLTITEHHHHDHFDLFPDYNRQVPFGTGTSICYNYLDYRFYNPTNMTFQLITYTTDEYLCGEIRGDKPLDYTYHIRSENDHFEKEGEQYYRVNQIYRNTIDKKTGNQINHELLRSNHALVLYELQECQSTISQ